MTSEEIISRISQRRRQILVHSIIYYEFDHSLISDHLFDMFCKELVELTHDFPEEAAKAALAEEYVDFETTGSGKSGFHMVGRVDRHWWDKARRLMAYHDSLRVKKEPT